MKVYQIVASQSVANNSSASKNGTQHLRGKNYYESSPCLSFKQGTIFIDDIINGVKKFWQELKKPAKEGIETDTEKPSSCDMTEEISKIHEYLSGS